MTEPNQQDITHHFMEMAEGKITDADLAAGSMGKLGGRSSKSAHYLMSSVGPASSVHPVQNVTSDIVQTVDQAKSRQGRAIKLDVSVDGDSLPAKPRTGNSSSRKKSKPPPPKKSKKSSSKKSKKKKKKK